VRAHLIQALSGKGLTGSQQNVRNPTEGSSGAVRSPSERSSQQSYPQASGPIAIVQPNPKLSAEIEVLL
jgi:hypothetical protein